MFLKNVATGSAAWLLLKSHLCVCVRWCPTSLFIIVELKNQEIRKFDEVGKHLEAKVKCSVGCLECVKRQASAGRKVMNERVKF